MIIPAQLIHLEGIGFNKAEKLIRKAKALTPMIEDKADKYLSEQVQEQEYPKQIARKTYLWGGKKSLRKRN